MNETVEDVMAQTPFDVIMAGMNNNEDYPHELVNGFQLGRNLNHTVFRNLLLTDANGDFEILSSSTTPTQYGTKSQVLNREIGDQFLHLENFTSYWGSNIYAEEEIIAGPKVNPRYHYCSTCSNDPAERSYNPFPISDIKDPDMVKIDRENISTSYPHNGILSKTQTFSSPTYTSTLHSLHVTDAGWQGFVDDEIIHIEPCSNTYTYVNKKSPATIEDSPPKEQASQDEATGISVYPNPAQTAFTVSVPQSFIEGTNPQLKIADFKGKTVFTQNINNQIHHINVKDLPSGVYIISVTSSTTVLTYKLVKS